MKPRDLNTIEHLPLLLSPFEPRLMESKGHIILKTALQTNLEPRHGSDCFESHGSTRMDAGNRTSNGIQWHVEVRNNIQNSKTNFYNIIEQLLDLHIFTS